VLEAVRRLEPGEVSRPIETEEGIEVLQRTASVERERYALTEFVVIHADAGRALPTAKLTRTEALSVAQTMLAQLVSGKTFAELRGASCKAPACLLLARNESRGRGIPELERALLAQPPGELVPEVVESAIGFHVAQRMADLAPEANPTALRFELPEPVTVDQMIVRSSKEELGAATRRAGREATEALGVEQPGVVALFDELAFGFETAPAEQRMILLASARARLRGLVGDELAAQIGAHVRGELVGSTAHADQRATRR
ncbi:MAG TPA: hypothetical protein VFZ61_29675, partial [Polyangiales bacterium]